MSAQDVLHGDYIVLNKGEESERKVSLAYYLQNIETDQDAMRGQIDAVRAELKGGHGRQARRAAGGDQLPGREAALMSGQGEVAGLVARQPLVVRAAVVLILLGVVRLAAGPGEAPATGGGVRGG